MGLSEPPEANGTVTGGASGTDGMLGAEGTDGALALADTAGIFGAA